MQAPPRLVSMVCTNAKHFAAWSWLVEIDLPAITSHQPSLRQVCALEWT